MQPIHSVCSIIMVNHAQYPTMIIKSWKESAVVHNIIWRLYLLWKNTFCIKACISQSLNVCYFDDCYIINWFAPVSESYHLCSGLWKLSEIWNCWLCCLSLTLELKLLKKMLIHIAQGWTWKCETCKTRIKCLRKTLKQLTQTPTPYTHTTTILVQEFGAFDIEKDHLCLKSRLFHFITGFIYLIASVVLRPYKRLDMLGVMYKSSIEWSLSFWDFGFQVFNSF